MSFSIIPIYSPYKPSTSIPICAVLVWGCAKVRTAWAEKLRKQRADLESEEQRKEDGRKAKKLEREKGEKKGKNEICKKEKQEHKEKKAAKEQRDAQSREEQKERHDKERLPEAKRQKASNCGVQSFRDEVPKTS